MAPDGTSVDELIATFMRDHEVAGMAVAIVQAPYITRATGFGVADPASRSLVSPNTLFELGRLGEAYAAVAVMQLVEAGKLGLDDALVRHVPGAPSDLTVRQLLARRTGDAASAALLQTLVAGASGETYETFVRHQQLDRLSLRHTFFASELAALGREDLTTTGRHREFLHQPSLIDPTEPAAGSRGHGLAPVPGVLWASAVDVSFWDIALAGEILIKDPGLRRLLYQPARTSDGASLATSGPWDFPGHPGLMVVTGGGSGFSSLLSRFTDPSELVCVTLLANQEGLDLSQLARRIAGAYDPKIGPPPGTADLRVQQSPWSVAVTADRLERVLRQGGATIMARLDHAEAASRVALALPPTQEILFGNPAVGTLLMQANRAVAVDLPLRAVIWEAGGEVWVAATDPVDLAARHHITDHQDLVAAMRASVDAALLSAVSP
jgi:CubicO group peptidase (beta-lactamase class C family)/uncharacterized protein (DUF302 family)